MFVHGTVAPDRGLLRSHIMKRYWGSRRHRDRPRTTPQQRILAPRFSQREQSHPTSPVKLLRSISPTSTAEKASHLSPKASTAAEECDSSIPRIPLLRIAKSSQLGCRVPACISRAVTGQLCDFHANQYRKLAIGRKSTVVPWRFDPFLNLPIELTPRIRKVLYHGTW